MSGVMVITGASRGIGAACALKAAQAGYDIVVNYRSDENAAENVRNRVTAAGCQAVTVKADMAEPGDITALFEAADRLGTLAGLVNNAGVVDVAARLDEMTPQRIERMMRINVTGAMLCAGEAVRRMSTRYGGKGGSIVNVGSIASVLGGAAQYVDYAASKGAIDSFTIGLARELAEEGIRVNGIRPGVIDTEIHASGGQPDRVQQLRGTVPMKREGRAEEVANGVIWLMSEEASYVTGTIMDISGGR